MVKKGEEGWRVVRSRHRLFTFVFCCIYTSYSTKWRVKSLSAYPLVDIGLSYHRRLVLAALRQFSCYWKLNFQQQKNKIHAARKRTLLFHFNQKKKEGQKYQPIKTCKKNMFPYININSCFFLGFSLLIFQNDFTQNPQLPEKESSNANPKCGRHYCLLY